MKILFVGSDEVWALENAYIKVFKDKCELRLFNAHGTFLKHYEKSIINKIIFRLGFSTILKKINKKLIEEASEFMPEVVFIFKGMEVFPSTLKILKQKGIRLINYNGDHPFAHFAKGSGNKNVLNSISLYDMHFSYSLEIIKEIEKNYNTPCKWLPFGYYTAIEADFSMPIKNKICFIGNPDKERVRIINLLAKGGFEIDVFGSNWQKENLEESSGLKLHPLLFKDDYNKKAQEYKLQLNIFRPHNTGSHNMRTFEMPALSCIMLAPRSKEHLMFFEEDKEVFYFDSDEELLSKCYSILKLDDAEANVIRKNAYNRSVNSKYSYDERAIFAFQEIVKLVEK